MNFADKTGRKYDDISQETYRVYEFPNKEIVRIEAPLKLNVSDSGGHRVWDAKGISHYIPKGWKHLYWETKEGEPNFVK